MAWTKLLRDPDTALFAAMDDGSPEETSTNLRSNGSNYKGTTWISKMSSPKYEKILTVCALVVIPILFAMHWLRQLKSKLWR